MPAVIAAIGMLWAKRQGKGKFRAYHDLVFERFWRRELDIEDPEAIAAVISEVHADRTGFRSYLAGAGRIELDTIRESAVRRRIDHPCSKAHDVFSRGHVTRIASVTRRSY